MNLKSESPIVDQGLNLKLLIKFCDHFFTTKEVGKGAGLGLYISKQIIEDHNGHIYVEASLPNTQFVVRLPLSQNFTARLFSFDHVQLSRIMLENYLLQKKGGFLFE